MQLVVPSAVSAAVRILTMNCKIVFQVCFFIDYKIFGSKILEVSGERSRFASDQRSSGEVRDYLLRNYPGLLAFLSPLTCPFYVANQIIGSYFSIV